MKWIKFIMKFNTTKTDFMFQFLSAHYWCFSLILCLNLNKYMFYLNERDKFAYQTVFHIVSNCLIGVSITIRLTNLERSLQCMFFASLSSPILLSFYDEKSLSYIGWGKYLLNKISTSSTELLYKRINWLFNYSSM